MEPADADLIRGVSSSHDNVNAVLNNKEKTYICVGSFYTMSEFSKRLRVLSGLRERDERRRYAISVGGFIENGRTISMRENQIDAPTPSVDDGHMIALGARAMSLSSGIVIGFAKTNADPDSVTGELVAFPRLRGFFRACGDELAGEAPNNLIHRRRGVRGLRK